MSRYFLILLAVVLTVGSCKKAEDGIAGTTWWTEVRVSSGGNRIYTEFVFTDNAFSHTMSMPADPSYPPARTTGTYTYEYPNIYLSCPDFHDVAVMASDRRSFTLDDTVFMKK